MALFRDGDKLGIYGMSLNSYNCGMMNRNNASEVLKLQTKIGEILRNEIAKQNLSLRQIERLSGVSKTAIARIVNAESDYNINTFTDVAHALGLRAWKVMAQAEKELAESPVSSTTPPPLSEEYITQLEQDLASGRYAYAAYTTPYKSADDIDNAGEESQIPDGWDE